MISVATCGLYKQTNAQVELTQLQRANNTVAKQIEIPTIMPVLSIIPFVLHLMTPISLELQAAGILQSNFTAYPLTPIKSSLADSRLILTTKLGKAGELPGKIVTQRRCTRVQIACLHCVVKSLLIIIINYRFPFPPTVPLFAELERSMSNMVRIYHQYKDESHVIKKTYFYTENCNGDLLLTEVCQVTAA